MAHPQVNGQVEVTNQIIIQGLKTKLEAAQGTWVEELPGVLWAYRTTVRAPIGETPFSMVYGTEIVISTKMLIMSARVQVYDPFNNEVQRRMKLDLIEEKWEHAWVQMEVYRQRIRHTFNRKVIPWSFQVGDLVPCKVNPTAEVRKLAPNGKGLMRSFDE